MEDHLIPHEKSVKETGIEEERRLMYVALTRAKKEIYATMSKMRRRMGQVAPSRPSRFLDEIPKELIKPLKL
jgi:DNA helicase-2/ATP-dependent DNA helicase PcrA